MNNSNQSMKRIQPRVALAPEILKLANKASGLHEVKDRITTSQAVDLLEATFSNMAESACLGQYSIELVDKQNDTIDKWTLSNNSEKAYDVYQEFMKNKEFLNKFSFSGDVEKVNPMHLEFIELFSDMEDLEDIYVFISARNYMDFWFIVSNETYKTTISFIKKANSFLRERKVTTYEFLIADKDQFRKEQMPIPASSFHKKGRDELNGK